MTFNKPLSYIYKFDKNAYTLLVAAVAVFYIYCAYKSCGYLQEDEHYQIIEFANYKLGTVPAHKLAWEFAAKIRSGLQPLISYLIISGLKLIGINDGYDITFIHRAITGLFSVYLIHKFISAYKKYIVSALKEVYLITSFLLWFLPYINIRFSSENLSGLMLICALTFLEKSNLCRRNAATIFTGGVLGLAALFRYQSFICIAGIFFWLLFVKKVKLGKVMLLLVGIVSILLLGIFIDFWLYGTWTLTAVNYFYMNIVKGVASNFGTEPFYQYLIYILEAPGLLGILILISFILLTIYYPKNLIVWVCYPFLLVHTIIPHKELRFLFPLVNLCPLILIIGLQKGVSLFHKRPRPTFKLTQLIFLILMFVILNLPGLYAISSTSGSAGKFSVAEYIDRHYDPKRLGITIVGNASPFIDWGVIQNSYYSSTGYRINRLVNIWQQEKMNGQNSSNNFKHILIIKASEIAGPKEFAHLESLGWKKKYQCIPNLTFFLYAYYDPDLRSQQTYIFENSN